MQLKERLQAEMKGQIPKTYIAKNLFLEPTTTFLNVLKLLYEEYLLICTKDSMIKNNYTVFWST